MTGSALNSVLLTAEIAERILEGQNRVSLDLGLSTTTVVVKEDQAVFENGSKVSLKSLRSILKRPNVVYIVDSKIRPVEFRNAHYYKLVPTSDAPALEIDGVRMHRTAGTTPLKDAREKIRVLGVHDGRVLEIGTGLGYTANAALDAGADQVVTIELSPSVLKIAQINPWSWRVLRDERMHIVAGDAYVLVSSLPLGFFDYVLNDPPLVAFAGHLYGSDFYAILFGILRQGGRMFHYVGEPGSKHRGIDLKSGIIDRLRKVGFTRFRYDEATKGVTCAKPKR